MVSARAPKSAGSRSQFTRIDEPVERSGAEWSPARSGGITDPPNAAVMASQLTRVFIPQSGFSLPFLQRTRLLQGAQTSTVSSVVFLDDFSSLAAV